MCENIEESLNSKYIILRTGEMSQPSQTNALSYFGDNPFVLDQEFGDENDTNALMFIRRSPDDVVKIKPADRQRLER
jgi:hypothetical protein